MKRFLRYQGKDACSRMMAAFDAAKECEGAGLGEAEDYFREASNLWAFVVQAEIAHRKAVRSC